MTNSETLVYAIGGINLGLSSKVGCKFAQQGRFPDFISTNPPLASYQVAINFPAGKPAGSLTFDSGQSWRQFSDGELRILWVGSRDYIPRLVGMFSPDYHSGEIYVTKSTTEKERYIFPLSYPLGELLMTSLLGTEYGIMLHSCAVIDGRDGMVFAGTSSAGKTTTAYLWHNNKGVRVLNDDHSILRKIDGEFRVYGTPWHGQGGLALAEDAPLKKVFIIKHGKSNKAVRLSPAQAAAAFLVRTFAPLWDAHAMAFTLQFLDELCQTIPCYELNFVPDHSAVEYVRCITSN